MTTADFLAHEARMAARTRQTIRADAIADGHERELQEQIQVECKRRGWICLSSRMDRKTNRVCGEPDMICLGGDGRVWFIEAKTKGGKLTPEQMSFAVHAKHLGHEVKTVRSLGEFIQHVNGSGAV